MLREATSFNRYVVYALPLTVADKRMRNIKTNGRFFMRVIFGAANIFWKE